MTGLDFPDMPATASLRSAAPAAAIRAAAQPVEAHETADAPAMPALRLPEGIHFGVRERDYHRDPGETPTASSSIIKAIVQKSPLHAHAKHARLNPGWKERAGSPAQSAGTVLHSLVLGTPAPYRVLACKEFRSDADKKLRDDTIDAGFIPMKAADMEGLQDVAASLRARLAQVPEIEAAIKASVAAGMVEATLIGRLNGVLCRARYDVLTPAGTGFTVDLKFTGLSSEPEDFGKTVEGDHAIQAAFYPRLLQSIRGDDPEFLFLSCETKPPYGVSIHAVSDHLRSIADEQIDAGLELWAKCLSSNQWPGYGLSVNRVEPKPWTLARWEEWKRARGWLPADRREAA